MVYSFQDVAYKYFRNIKFPENLQQLYPNQIQQQPMKA